MTSAATERRSRSLTVVRGLLYSALFVATWTWLAVAARRFDPELAVSIPRLFAPIGFVIAAAGTVLAAACVATFLTLGRGTPAPFDPPQLFVAVGPYRYVRNPMYIGGGAVILGAGLVFGSPSILLLAAVYMLIAHLFVVLYEEPALTAKFGDSYLRYRSLVPRWLVRKPRFDGIDPLG